MIIASLLTYLTRRAGLAIDKKTLGEPRVPFVSEVVVGALRRETLASEAQQTKGTKSQQAQ